MNEMKNAIENNRRIDQANIKSEKWRVGAPSRQRRTKKKGMKESEKSLQDI